MQRFVSPQLAEVFTWVIPVIHMNSLKSLEMNWGPINTRWTSCDDVRVEHHEGQTAIPLKGMFGMELQDRLSLGFI